MTAALIAEFAHVQIIQIDARQQTVNIFTSHNTHASAFDDFCSQLFYDSVDWHPRRLEKFVDVDKMVI